MIEIFFFRAKTFAGNEEMKQASRLIVKKEKNDIASHSTFEWTNEPIDVPPVPPRLSRCKIIENAYMIELEVCFSLFSYFQQKHFNYFVQIFEIQKRTNFFKVIKQIFLINQLHYFIINISSSFLF